LIQQTAVEKLDKATQQNNEDEECADWWLAKASKVTASDHFIQATEIFNWRRLIFAAPAKIWLVPR